MIAFTVLCTCNTCNTTIGVPDGINLHFSGINYEFSVISGIEGAVAFCRHGLLGNNGIFTAFGSLNAVQH